MGSEHYCLRWNNHQSNLLGVFSQLLESESLVDVTLACTEGPSIRAHKVVLSACSSYFQTLFLDHPNRHPIVILKDVRFSELRTLVDFMYKGEVNVEYCQLSALLKTAESLKVKGLADMTNINAAVATRDEQQHHHHHHHHHQQQQHHQHHQQQHHHHHNNDTSRETRNDTTRERDKEHRIDKEYNDKDNLIKDELKLQNSHKEHIQIQQNKHNSLINQHINDNSEAVDMTECPLTPKREIDSSPERPLALDRPRRDSDDAASLDDTRASISPVSVHSGPSDMSLTNNTTTTTTTTAATTTTTTTSSSSSSSSSSLSNNNNNNNNSTNTTTATTTTTTTTTPPTPTTTPGALSQSRLPSPHSTEPLAGPSGLPPVQQVPLSLKKEMDWDRSSDERCASSELSTDYRLPPDPELMGVDERVFACMYCGATFLHQSKLTRHILSHSLESLKYREQAAHLQLQAQLGIDTTIHLPPESHYSTSGQVETMDIELSSHSDPTSGVVLCKFCGKSFPDVGSLISHLPAHTGDRPFKCEFCGKAFKLRHHMKDHCRVHTGERPFRCTLCGKTFSRSTILKAHEKTHYPKYVRKFLSPSPVDQTEEETPQPQPPPPPPHH